MEPNLRTYKFNCLGAFDGKTILNREVSYTSLPNFMYFD